MKLSEELEIINEARLQVPVDVDNLCRALGIKLKRAFLSSSISGMIEQIGGQFTITLNLSDSYTRQRFTLAHELGHYIRHRQLIGDGIDDDRGYRSTDQGKYHNTKIGSKEETEANKIAANILMPREAISREWGKPNSTISQMAQLFGVSEHAMSIRLRRPFDG